MNTVTTGSTPPTTDKSPSLVDTFKVYLNSYTAARLGFSTPSNGDHMHFAAAQAFGVHDAKKEIEPCNGHDLADRTNALMVAKPKS